MVLRIWAILIGLLIIRFISFSLTQTKNSYQSGSIITINLPLESEPTIVNGVQRFFLGDIQIITNDKTYYHYGDNMSVTGYIICPRKQLSCSAPYINQPRISINARMSGNPWVKTAITIRSGIERNIRYFLRPAEANLLIGILIGGTNLDRNFKSQLANVGLTHVVAASGMNVTFMVGFFVLFLSALRIKRILKAILIILFICFYSTITGFEPPIVRASIMAGFVLFANTLGRPSSSFFALAISAYLMLWADPTLAKNPSFLLSFTSMIGQIITGNLRLELPIVIKLIIENFLQSLASIIATLPIILIFFAKFSLISTITNVLVLWTIEPLMFLGTAAIIISFSFHNLSPILFIPASVILDYFLQIVRFFNRPEFLLITPPLSISFALGYYLFLGSAIIFVHDRNRQ